MNQELKREHIQEKFQTCLDFFQTHKQDQALNELKAISELCADPYGELKKNKQK